MKSILYNFHMMGASFEEIVATGLEPATSR